MAPRVSGSPTCEARSPGHCPGGWAASGGWKSHLHKWGWAAGGQGATQEIIKITFLKRTVLSSTSPSWRPLGKQVRNV